MATIVVFFSVTQVLAEPIAVKHTAGLLHGFLLLKNEQGAVLADGDLTQVAHRDRVTSHMVFRFKDGSVHDETAVFSQRGVFKLLQYHLLQRGAAFERPIDFSIDGATGQIQVRAAGKKAENNHLDLPADLANGMVPTLLLNVGHSSATVSMVALTPKPRLVKLAISAGGKQAFWVGNSQMEAIHYVVKIQIGGVAGAVAPIVGKQPPDIQVWVASGEVPSFVKSEGPLYAGGPIWRIELTSPVWAKPTDSENRNKSH